MNRFVCKNGLANRINLLVQCLCEGGGQVLWGVGPHCSLPHGAIFPDGVPGVEFVNELVGARTCWCVSEPAGENLRRAARTVYDAFLPGFVPEVYDAVVFVRRILQPRDFVLKNYLEAVGRELWRGGGVRVKLQIDLQSVSARKWLGYPSVPQRCVQMRHDLDRECLWNQVLFAMDLKELWAARRVLSPSVKSTMTDMRDHLNGGVV